MNNENDYTKSIGFGYDQSEMNANDLIAPTVACSLEFKSGRLLDELLQRKINNHAKQVLPQRQDLMKWSHDE